MTNKKHVAVIFNMLNYRGIHKLDSKLELDAFIFGYNSGSTAAGGTWWAATLEELTDEQRKRIIMEDL